MPRNKLIRYLIQKWKSKMERNNNRILVEISEMIIKMKNVSYNNTKAVGFKFI